MKSIRDNIIVLSVATIIAFGCSGMRPSFELQAINLVGAREHANRANPSDTAKPLTDTVSKPAAYTSRLVSIGSLPLSFEANDGQTDPEVKFISRGAGYMLFLTDRDAVFSLRQPRKQPPAATKRELSLPVPVESSVLRMQLIGGQAGSDVSGVEELPGKSNYFIGSDPTKWRTNVTHYKRVKYDSVYPGIDLEYYGNQGRLEFDFIVAPGADPSLIQMAFAGADALNVDDRGTLIVYAGGAEVRLQSPVVYQAITGQRKNIAARYVIHGQDDGNNTSVRIGTVSPLTVGFQLAAYDTTKALIIDPVLVYSTYLGAGGADFANSIAVDAAANMYVTGSTTSTNFPTSNALRGKNSGGTDIFITKLNAAGSQLVYSTYFGGNGADNGTAIALDAAGNVYVTGSTSSSNFPTMNPIQPTHGAGANDDAFVTKLNSTGSALIYSTYLGGSALDQSNAIALDFSGNVYVAGATESTDFPTANALQPNLAGGRDAFITKINGAGNALVYSTYLGGSTEWDYARAIAVDASENAYLAGLTYSTDFPVVNPIQPMQNSTNGSSDAFIAKLNAAGNTLVYSTYLGGSAFDTARSIAVDIIGNIYLTGTTQSVDFPTANPIDAVLSGFSDIFVTKLNAAGDALVYSTYIGGSEEESGTAIAVDAAGNAYIGGSSSSTDFPTISASQPKYPGTGLAKAVIVKLNASGSTLVFSTFFGGSGVANEAVASLKLDTAGNIYIVGDTNSTDMPTVNPIQGKISGSFEPADAFIAKISQVVNCPTNSLQFAIDNASPGESVSVRGTCSENILIRNEKQRITIDGSGAGAGTRATVNGSAGAPVFNVRGKGILIQNFNIAGGSDGVHVNRGSNAVLNNNVIANSSGSGTVVEQLAYSVLTNNTIQNHPVSGISISENSTARIGFNSDAETVASTNTIQNNGVGILVSNGSSARIVGNTIQNNSGDGVQVLRVSHADISNNTINANGDDGIEVTKNSSVQLGEDTGTSIFESPNLTTSSNEGFGLHCTTGGVADGRAGTLTGSAGATDFAAICINGLSL